MMTRAVVLRRACGGIRPVGGLDRKPRIQPAPPSVDWGLVRGRRDLVQRASGCLVAVMVLVAAAGEMHGQAVAVTMRLDTNTLAVGDTTLLHVYAQVVPALRVGSDRIFSWYLDLVNTNAGVGAANYGVMLKPASDNDPLTSSMGFTQGTVRRGIYDTFLNLPGAGVASPVELVRVPVLAVATGQTRFVSQPGSGVAGLSADFLVVQSAGGDPLTGGDYGAASATLQVTSGSGTCALDLTVARVGNGGPGENLVLTFTPCPGRTHTVEARTGLGDVQGWQSLPGAPHNSGTVTVTNATSQRFFRVRATSP